LGLLRMAAAAMGNEQVRNRATLGATWARPPRRRFRARTARFGSVRAGQRTGGRPFDPGGEVLRRPEAQRAQKGEIIVGILIPEATREQCGRFREAQPRKAGDLSVVSVAVLASPLLQEGPG
jgi:CO/xanthine dehydrogenase FAD-binding subunit